MAKYMLNNSLLSDYFMKDTPSREAVAEMDRVILVVMIKHFSRFSDNEDLKQMARIALLDRRKNYDPARGPYNFAYTIIRNTIGNALKKVDRLTFCDVQDPTNPLSKECSEVEARSEGYSSEEEEMARIPEEVRPYIDYLLGSKFFTALPIPKKSVAPLLAFISINSNDKSDKTKTPTFIQNSKNTIDALYKCIASML